MGHLRFLPLDSLPRRPTNSSQDQAFPNINIKGIGFIPSPYIPKTVLALDVKGKQVLFRLALKPRSLALIVLSCSQSDGTSNQGDMDADFPGIICSLLKLADPFEGVGFSLLAFSACLCLVFFQSLKKCFLKSSSSLRFYASTPDDS